MPLRILLQDTYSLYHLNQKMSIESDFFFRVKKELIISGQYLELLTLVIGFGFHGLAIPIWIKIFLK